MGSKERKRKRTYSGKGFLTRSHYRRQTGSVFIHHCNRYYCVWLFFEGGGVVLLPDIFTVSPIPAAAAITQTWQQVTQYQSGQRDQSRSPEGSLTLPPIIVRTFHSRAPPTLALLQISFTAAIRLFVHESKSPPKLPIRQLFLTLSIFLHCLSA